MTNKVTNKENAEHYKWGDNCDSWVLTDTVGLSIKLESMPGATTEITHYHRYSQQFFFILKGKATFYFEGHSIVVDDQNGILIPPNIKHAIVNETNAQLDFLVISQPTINNDRITIE